MYHSKTDRHVGWIYPTIKKKQKERKFSFMHTNGIAAEQLYGRQFMIVLF
jgi:hypothetical protein